MAALTLSQIEAQVRALLSDAGAGSLEFTPEQMARAIDFAQVQTAKQLGVTYYESPLEVVDRKVAIPLDAISVIRVETTDFSPRLYGPTAFFYYIGPDEPGDSGGELDFYYSYEFAGDVVEVDAYFNPVFRFYAASFKPKIAMQPSDGVFSVVVRVRNFAFPESELNITATLFSDTDYVDPRIDEDVINVHLPWPPGATIFGESLVTISVIRPWISMDESLEASFHVMFG